MTINEYKELHQLSYRALAERCGVSIGTVVGWVRGNRAKPENAEVLKQLGIEHPILDPKGCSRKIRREDNEIILNYFQIHAVKTYGNTIVSKKHSPEEIIKAFRDIRINVKVREYENADVFGGDTHYVVIRV